MPPLSTFLLPTSVSFSLSSATVEGAVEELLLLLQEDERISNWEELRESILSRPAFPLPVSEESAIMIYHGRTQSVQDLILAVGRSDAGILMEGATHPVHFIFIAGIPHTLSTEYLRIMGAIARACKDDAILEKLHTLHSAQELIDALSQISDA